MLDSAIFAWIHHLVGWLLEPVTVAMLALLALAVWDVGVACGERFGGLAGFVLGRLRRRWYDELLDAMVRETEGAR